MVILGKVRLPLQHTIIFVGAQQCCARFYTIRVSSTEKEPEDI
jgi:hypothetical protein